MEAYLLLSLRNIRRRKLRSYLTILGVIIGMSSVVALISVSSGIQRAVEEQFSRFGADKITVVGGKGMAPVPMFEKDIAEELEHIEGVEVATPLGFLVVMVEKGNKVERGYLSGVEAKKMEKIMEEAQGFSLRAGRYPKKGKKEVVLGAVIARGVEADVGDRVEIGGQRYRVVGVLNEVGNNMDDRSIITSLETYTEVAGNKYPMLMLKVSPGAELEEVKEEVKRVLKRKLGHENFNILTAEEMKKQVSMILSMLSLLLVAIAGISLVVGAVGIMNTMYMAVVERTREIGIMKAVGAKRRQILLLFLMESGIIGLIGGVLGVIVGGAISVGIGAAGKYFLPVSIPGSNFLPDPLLVGAVIGLSFLLGAVSGYLPARAAASLNPVEALRYE